MIEIVDLQKSFGAKQVLRDVNLRIEDGKTTCILGGSGSGKSTIMNLIIVYWFFNGFPMFPVGSSKTRSVKAC